MILQRLAGHFPHLTTVSFLSPQAFIIGTVTNRQDKNGDIRRSPSLDLYGVPPLPDGWDSSEGPPCKMLARLHLPPLSPNVRSAEVWSRSEPGPYLQTSSSPPFYPDPSKRIFTVSLHMLVLFRSHFDWVECTFFVHSDAFFKLVGESVLTIGQLPPGTDPHIIPWAAWSKYTRLIRGGTPYHSKFSQFDTMAR